MARAPRRIESKRSRLDLVAQAICKQVYSRSCSCQESNTVRVCDCMKNAAIVAAAALAPGEITALQEEDKAVEADR